MGTSITLGTLAVVYVLGAFFFWPPQSRVALFVYSLAVFFIPVFGVVATAAGHGLVTLDNVLGDLRGSIR